MRQTEARLSTRQIMLATHEVWLRVVRDHGSAVADLKVFAALPIAKVTESLPKDLAGRREVARLAKAFSLLRAGEFDLAEKALALTARAPQRDPPLAFVGLCWAAVAASLSGRLKNAKRFVKEARRIHREKLGSDGSAGGLVAFVEGLLLYKQGGHQAALALLDEAHRAFLSPHAAGLGDFPAFDAEVYLTRAKTLREMGLYDRAAVAVEEAQLLRVRNGDRLGEAWGCLESARLCRFRDDFDAAERQLQRAEILLRGSGFAAGLARIEDQRGDIARRMNRLDEAEGHYRRAIEISKDSGNRLLDAHLADSLARLFEERGDGRKALEFLERHEATWRGTKAHGKFLYLLGTIHARIGNLAEAERLLSRSVEELRKCEMRSYEALALARLADVLMNIGKTVAACRAWAEALRVAPKVEAARFLKTIEERANQLRAVELLSLVSSLTADQARLSAELEDEKAAAETAAVRRLAERHLLGHWFAGPMLQHLSEPRKTPSGMLCVLKRFCAILRNPRWHLTGTDRPTFQEAQDIDVAKLARECATAVTKSLKIPLKIHLPRYRVHVSGDAWCLREAIEALLRGASTAFGTRTYSLSAATCRSEPRPRILRFALLEPKPKNFGRAAELTRLETAMREPDFRPVFKSGYTGDLTLLDFLVNLPLWGKLEYDDREPSIVIRLPEPTKKGP